ncbi:MAG: class I SAM-dependent methyltransferase [Methylocella sp.]
MEQLIERLVAERPHFHAWPDGKPANWAVAPDVLRYIFKQLKPGMQTLETGAGQTTAAFAIAGTEHIAITPDRAQADRIRSYLDGLKVPTKVTFIHESSDVVLPSGQGIPERLDFVLIDGAHRFPFPILDWHYTECRVPVGGIVAVDDYLMPSVRILHDFLLGEEDWKLLITFQATAFFRRVHETVNVWDWADQKINKLHLEKLALKSSTNSQHEGFSRFIRRLLGSERIRN